MHIRYKAVIVAASNMWKIRAWGSSIKHPGGNYTKQHSYGHKIGVIIISVL